MWRIFLGTVAMWAFTCLLAMCNTGCEDSSYYQPPSTILSGKPDDWTLTSDIQPPIDWSQYDKELTLVIESEPPGAEVYSVEKLDSGGFRAKEKIGTTPLEIKIEFCELNGIPWFKDPAILNGYLSSYRPKGAPMKVTGAWSSGFEVSYPHKGAYWSPLVEQHVSFKSRSGGGSYSTPYLHEVKIGGGNIFITENELQRRTVSNSILSITIATVFSSTQVLDLTKLEHKLSEQEVQLLNLPMDVK